MYNAREIHLTVCVRLALLIFVYSHAIRITFPPPHPVSTINLKGFLNRWGNNNKHHSKHTNSKAESQPASECVKRQAIKRQRYARYDNNKQNDKCCSTNQGNASSWFENLRHYVNIDTDNRWNFGKFFDIKSFPWIQWVVDRHRLFPFPRDVILVYYFGAHIWYRNCCHYACNYSRQAPANKTVFRCRIFKKILETVFKHKMCNNQVSSYCRKNSDNAPWKIDEKDNK